MRIGTVGGMIQTNAQTVELHLGPEELVISNRYEVLSIANDILIGIWFLVGSCFFFSESLMFAGTVLFVIGSARGQRALMKLPEKISNMHLLCIMQKLPLGPAIELRAHLLDL